MLGPAHAAVLQYGLSPGIQESVMNWLNALAIFAVGVVSGALLLYLLLPARRQYGRLMRERDEARKALNDYRRQVDHHFVRTAELVNQMTESYRQVHEHLSSGARDLCSEAGRRLASDASLDALSAEDTASAETPETGPPLDYAPSARGTLSEDYGLEKKGATPFEPVDDLDNSDEPVTEPAAPPRDYADTGDRPEAGDDDAVDWRSG
jgi:uncharacterized membrane-anchored protein YhcB (DUF1043 family)